jgi:hypothetical protein
MDDTNQQTPFEGSIITCERIALAMALHAKLMGADDEGSIFPKASRDSMIALLASAAPVVAEA